MSGSHHIVINVIHLGIYLQIAYIYTQKWIPKTTSEDKATHASTVNITTIEEDVQEDMPNLFVMAALKNIP